MPTNYLRILNENADKNTQKYKRQQNVQKIRQMVESLLPVKIRGIINNNYHIQTHNS